METGIVTGLNRMGILLECLGQFIKDFYGRYVLMFIVFLLAMRVSVVMVNVLTGHGLHLGGYIGTVDRIGKRDYKDSDGNDGLTRFRNRHKGSRWS